MLTVTAAFAGFRSNLEITGLQESLVAARQAKVRAAVARGLTVLGSFLTGSYRRSTLIAPMRDADVDIMVVLDRGYRRRGPRAVLDLVKKTLRETYPSSKISRNGQAVTITFSDFTVDVVPAFPSGGTATAWTSATPATTPGSEPIRGSTSRSPARSTSAQVACSFLP